jgi:hypothetical protein
MSNKVSGNEPELSGARPALKLYVWTDVLCDYTCGVAFALASSVEEARQLVTDSLGYERGDFEREPDVITDAAYGLAVWGGG